MGDWCDGWWVWWVVHVVDVMDGGGGMGWGSVQKLRLVHMTGEGR